MILLRDKDNNKFKKSNNKIIRLSWHKQWWLLIINLILYNLNFECIKL